MKWDRFRIKTTTEAEDMISYTLSDCGVEGVEIEDNVPLTSQDTAKMFIDILPELGRDEGIGYVSFYLPAEEDHTDMLARIRAELESLREFMDIGECTIEESQTEDVDWANNWKEFFHSFYVEDIFIKPTWEEAEDTENAAVTIEIDPGISFGTGKHETTQLCIRGLRKYMKPGDRVLDLGCGSGILSIVSLKLGASHVTGTDIDADCITSTRENFEVNHLGDEDGTFYVGDLITDDDLAEKVCTGDYDVVAANILADVIIPMAKRIPPCLKPGGIFISSGIIDFKENAVCDAVREAGLEILEVGHQGEWVSVIARRPE